MRAHCRQTTIFYEFIVVWHWRALSGRSSQIARTRSVVETPSAGKATLFARAAGYQSLKLRSGAGLPPMQALGIASATPARIEVDRSRSTSIDCRSIDAGWAAKKTVRLRAKFTR